MKDKPMSDELISGRQAAKLGVERLRKPVWADPLDHLKIDIVNGDLGPWAHLFAPFNQECNGRDPVDLLWAIALDPDAKEFVPYDGPMPEAEEYLSAVKSFEGVLS